MRLKNLELYIYRNSLKICVYYYYYHFTRFTKKESAAYGVLSYIYGSKAPLKYSQPKGIISEVVSKFTDAFSVSNVNISYPDSGLIGFLLSAPSDKIGQVIYTIKI